MCPRKLMQCEACGYTTDRKSNLSAHQLRKHTRREGYPYVCQVCDLRCAALQDVARHQASAHPAPTIAEARRFESTMALVDMVVSATVESWFWTLPSNRFTDCQDLLYSQKKKALNLLNDLRTGIQNQEDVTESILGILNTRLDQELTSFARKMVTGLLEILEGVKGLQLNQVDQYGEDGAGTKKGFAVYATTDIPAGATFPMVYGELVPIPNGKQADPSQNFSRILVRGRECNLAGPLQFVNHSCTGWNTKYVSGPGKKFLYLKVTENIKLGHEVFVHYSGRDDRVPNSWEPECFCCQ